jgi:hypothetical protein
VPETPEQLHERAAGALRMPPVEEWETFPFDGEMRPRPLLPPAPVDPRRQGEGGAGRSSCARSDEEFLWTNERWRLYASPRNGLPVMVLLETREHYAEPRDLPEDLASELGVLIARIDRAVHSIGEIGRVHACRWAMAANTCTGGSSVAQLASLS